MGERYVIGSFSECTASPAAAAHRPQRGSTLVALVGPRPDLSAEIAVEVESRLSVINQDCHSSFSRAGMNGFAHRGYQGTSHEEKDEGNSISGRSLNVTIRRCQLKDLGISSP